MNKGSRRCIIWVGVSLASCCLYHYSVHGADFTVTTPNDQYAYNINNLTGNPTITLVRGKIYTFSINTSADHPFAFGTDIGFPAPPGVTGANASSLGIITFNVPTNAPDCVYYCVIHDFSGQVHMIDPVQAPTVTIVGLTLGTNLTLKTVQATTNGFTFVPEANSQLGITNWFALTVQGSRFANGTNEIFCGKPAGTNVFVRIRIQ